LERLRSVPPTPVPETLKIKKKKEIKKGKRGQKKDILL